MKKVCARAGCRNITNKRYCLECESKAKQGEKDAAKRRARKALEQSDPKFAAFYRSQRWKNLRDKKIKQDPLCETCRDNGFIKEGYDVDHVVEIKDDYSKCLDMSNLRTLCRSCHAHKTHRERVRRQSAVREELSSRWL